MGRVGKDFSTEKQREDQQERRSFFFYIFDNDHLKWQFEDGNHLFL